MQRTIHRRAPAQHGLMGEQLLDLTQGQDRDGESRDQRG